MNKFETDFRDNLAKYLQGINEVDEHLPEAPDIEALWATVGEAYLPDAIKEFNKFPTVALGWSMYMGMAMAQYWDEDWDTYGKIENHYTHLLSKTDFDHLDDYIRKEILRLDDNAAAQLEKTVAECASRLVNTIAHMHIEPGSEDAFKVFIAALHQMYLMGAAIQLKRLGYHMTKLGE